MRPSNQELQAHEYGEQLARASWDLARLLDGVPNLDAAYFETAYFLTHVTLDVLHAAVEERQIADDRASPLLYAAQATIVNASVCYHLGISADMGCLLPLVQLQRVADLATRHLHASFARQRWYHGFEPRVTDPGAVSGLPAEFCRQLARSAGMAADDRRLDRLAASVVAALVAIDPAALARTLLEDLDAGAIEGPVRPSNQLPASGRPG
jgi:hypothetical protein